MSTVHTLQPTDEPPSFAQPLLDLVQTLNPTAFVALLAPDGTLIQVNTPALAFIGCMPEDVLGQHFADTPWWQGCETARRCLRRALKLARRGTPSRFTQQAQSPSGAWHTRHFSLMPVFDGQSRVVQLVASSVPVADPLTRQIDPCTGLPNRTEMRLRLQAGLQQGQALDLLLIDLDRFKRINDTLGQAAGDELLRLAGERLKQTLPEAELLAGVGGDEFAVLLRRADPALAAERVLQAFAQPFELAGREVFVSCSIGCASTADGSVDVSELVRQAGTALHRAKAAGRNGLHVFTAEPDELDPDALALESALRRAIERQQLRLHYQPQIDLASGCIAGAEALLRWRHPALGEVSPARFIPIAEESGLIGVIGDWVLREAIAAAAAWQQAGLTPIRIAVNLSGRQLRQPGLAQRIEQMLAERDLDPRWLAVEVTESMLVDNFAQTSTTLKRLQALGIEVAIDDFGTGYSGLNYLRQLPVDVVKIDRCFIPDVAAPPDQVSMTRALIQLAHSLQMRVVAEGIETERHRQLLAEQQCDFAQGFLFSAALPGAQLQALLQAQAAPSERPVAA
jgi:diguanylate cyclase (GGDEF)-like protein